MNREQIHSFILGIVPLLITMGAAPSDIRASMEMVISVDAFWNHANEIMAMAMAAAQENARDICTSLGEDPDQIFGKRSPAAN